MNGIRSLLWRLGSYLRRQRLEEDLDQELRFHLEMEIEQNLSRGMSPAEARRSALMRLGGVEQVKEAYREQRGLPRLESVLQDLRFAVRSLRRSPAFTLTVLLVTAIAIGANTAIFSVVNAVMLAPLPFPEPDRLVQLMRQYPSGYSYPALTGRMLEFVEQNFGGFENLGASGSGSGHNLVWKGEAEYIRALPVSAGYFPMLGVQPRRGRNFRPEEDLEGGPQAVLLSHGLWQRLFGSDPSAVGQTVRLGGEPYTVVGVMPEGFQSIPPFQAWIPLRAATNLQGRGFNYSAVGRLTSGVSLQQAQHELDSVSQAFRQTYSDIPQGIGFRAVGYQDSLSSGARPALMLLAASVGLVLLIGCANISSLMMARACTRQQEMAVRSAMGGMPRRIVRQLLTESLLLALAGGALGMAAAWWCLQSLLSLAPDQLVPSTAVGLDGRVLLFTLSVSVLTGILFGLAPAWQSARLEVATVLQGASTRSVGGDRHTRFRSLLVVAEVAVCTVLLVGSGLLAQTFANLMQVDLGFDPKGILTGQMSLQGSRSKDAESLTAFYRDALERIEKLPGVEAAALSNNLPVEGGLNLNIRMETLEGMKNFSVDWRYVTQDYFRIMRIPLLQGRTLQHSDNRQAVPVALVNQQFARKFFSGESALGRPIELGGTLRIVGLVGDVKSRGLDNPPLATIYVPAEQVPAQLFEIAHSYFQVNWLIRSKAGAAALDLASVGQIIRSLDPALPFSGFRSMDQVLQGSLQRQRFLMVLLTALALVALAMAVAGIYGLISYQVSLRRREIGIRMAIGAGWRVILGKVVRQGTVLTSAGAVVGMLLSLASMRLIEQFLFNVSPSDPATLATAALVLLGASALASLVPGVRALRSATIMDLLEE